MSDADLYVDDMYVNFSKILPRVLDSINKTDLQDFFDKLSSIEGPTLITGVGGSSIVGEFLAKVLSKKNGIIAQFVFPRDLKFMNLKEYKNVISVSYSGRNIGVDASFKNDLNKYLLSGSKKEGIIPLQYKVDDEEYSYVSLAGTFIPLSLILLYYKYDLDFIKEILSIDKKYEVDDTYVYEIMSSKNSSTAERMFESTLVEGSLSAPVFHEKYNYCHGRTMFNQTYHNPLIYFDDDSELDKLFKDKLFKTYDKVYLFEKKYDDEVLNDYYFTYLALLFCKAIAIKKNIDMSIKHVPEISEIVYYYNGEL